VITLLPSEIRRQVGRRGSFFGATIWISLFGLGVFVWAILNVNASGAKAIESGGGLLTFAVALASIVVGATAGAYDVDQGIMRYLVMTGRPRLQLVLVRVPALIATVVLMTLPALVMILLGSVIAGGPSASGGAYFDLLYMTWMTGLLYGVLSLAIGMFMKSNGVAIAVAVVLNFAGLLIAGAIMEYVSKDLGNAFFPVVAGVVIARDSGEGADAALSVGLSAVLVAGWLIAALGAAYARVQRTEY
jgi:ABC-type transport system involved in multi-copper enzyme maturation permease subunit